MRFRVGSPADSCAIAGSKRPTRVEPARGNIAVTFPAVIKIEREILLSCIRNGKYHECTQGDQRRRGTRRGRLERRPRVTPSAKLVAKVLEYDGTLTQSQLADETLLPPRTVRYALNRLEDVGVVDSRFSFADARKRIYTLTIE